MRQLTRPSLKEVDLNATSKDPNVPDKLSLLQKIGREWSQDSCTRDGSGTMIRSRLSGPNPCYPSAPYSALLNTTSAFVFVAKGQLPKGLVGAAPAVWGRRGFKRSLISTSCSVASELCAARDHQPAPHRTAPRRQRFHFRAGVAGGRQAQQRFPDGRHP
jgi:hypothetical protein